MIQTNVKDIENQCNCCTRNKEAFSGITIKDFYQWNEQIYR